MNEMITRYMEMYNDMATSKMPEKMHVFGEAEKWAFEQMVSLAPHKAQMWLNKLEPICWHNYLSREEADEIVGHLVNQDGSAGGNWGYDTFINAVKGLGGMIEEKPYYNTYALWVTANMLYSDHHESAREFVPKEQMPKYFYKMAVEQLKDIDKPRFIREYFDL